MLTPNQMRQADASDFRSFFGNLPAAVSVVTTMEGSKSIATTVTSFGSMSLDPPLAGVSLDSRSRLLAAALRSRRVGVNVLASDQKRVADACASSGDDKLATIDWTLDSELPRIRGTAGWAACDIADVLNAGDHHVLVLSPQRIETRAHPPLIYHDRAYRLVGELAG